MKVILAVGAAGAFVCGLHAYPQGVVFIAAECALGLAIVRHT